MITVEATADGWNGKQKEAARARIKAVSGELVYRFENLPPGSYAVQVLHDENDNGKLDSNIVERLRERSEQIAAAAAGTD